MNGRSPLYETAREIVGVWDRLSPSERVELSDLNEAVDRLRFQLREIDSALEELDRLRRWEYPE